MYQIPYESVMSETTSGMLIMQVQITPTLRFRTETLDTSIRRVQSCVQGSSKSWSDGRLATRFHDSRSMDVYLRAIYLEIFCRSDDRISTCKLSYRKKGNPHPNAQPSKKEYISQSIPQGCPSLSISPKEPQSQQVHLQLLWHLLYPITHSLLNAKKWAKSELKWGSERRCRSCG